MSRAWFFGSLALVLLAAQPAAAQPEDPVRLSLAIVAADDRLQALAESDDADSAAAREAEAALAALCAETEYGDVETCVDIARNEKWVPTGTAGCRISAGRAWGCSTTAFAPAERP